MKRLRGVMMVPLLFSWLRREVLPARRRPCKPWLEVLEDRNLLSLWFTVTSMPTARGFLAGATGVDFRIYAIGGKDNSGNFLSTVEAYTPGPDSWSTRASMHTARDALAAVAAVDGRIYALGGFAQLDGGAYLNTVEAYSPGPNSWSTLTPMTTARTGLAGAAGFDGRIFALGGYNPTSGYLSSAEACSLGPQAWSPVASMSTAHYGAAAATGPDGRIYVFGGFDGTNVLHTVEAYGPGNKWTTVAPMLTAREFPAAARGTNGRLYVFGGFDSSGNALNTVESYNPDTNSWSPVVQMPTARGGLAAATGFDGRIYAVGGESGMSFSGPYLNTAEALQYFSGFLGGAASDAKSPTLVSGDPTSSTVMAATATVAPVQAASSSWAVPGNGASDNTVLRDGADVVFAAGADTVSENLAGALFAGGIG